MKDTFWNKIFLRKHRIYLTLNDREYEIEYHKHYFFWQDKVNLRSIYHNIMTNHWDVNQIFHRDPNKKPKKGRKGYSTINCMGHGSGIIHGLFPKKKMLRQLKISAQAWDKVRPDS